MAVATDANTRERRLETGAIVLAERSLVFADTFDKMVVNDCISNHDAMEQQNVNISKSGMHASLNARFSVLTVNYLVYGKYDR